MNYRNKALNQRQVRAIIGGIVCAVLVLLLLPNHFSWQRPNDDGGTYTIEMTVSLVTQVVAVCVVALITALRVYQLRHETESLTPQS